MKKQYNQPVIEEIIILTPDVLLGSDIDLDMGEE